MADFVENSTAGGVTGWRIDGPGLSNGDGRGTQHARTRLTRSLARAFRLLAVLLVVSTLSFFAIQLLPGGPVQAILGVTATEEAVAALNQQLGLDRPIWEQYVTWLGNLAQGDLGQSYRTRQPVIDIVSNRLPVTLQLILAGQVLALVASVPLALAGAYRRDTAIDRSIGLFVFSALSAPHFVIGVVLIWILSVNLGWLPSTGFSPISDGLGSYFKSLLMPAVALAAAPFAQYQRVLRADLVETLGRQFMVAARAKGISPFRAAFSHALRPSLLGLSTVVGVTIGVSIGSSVVVETLFGFPGLGAELVNAVQTRDFPAVQGIVLVIAAGFVLINAAIDILYAVLDPRLRRPGIRQTKARAA